MPPLQRLCSNTETKENLNMILHSDRQAKSRTIVGAGAALTQRVPMNIYFLDQFLILSVVSGLPLRITSGPIAAQSLVFCVSSKAQVTKSRVLLLLSLLFF